MSVAGDAPPLVSAIVPAFNAQAHIGEAVESILAQTYQSVECLVIDDGSTDGTSSVVDGFGSHVRLIQQINAGVAAARNRGVREAKGRFVAFLDADDVWLPDKLARQV